MRMVEEAPEESGSEAGVDAEREAMRCERNLRKSRMDLNKSTKAKFEKGNSKSEFAQRKLGIRIFFELLDVALLDLLHEGFALEEIIMEVGGELAGNDEELIVKHLGEGNRSTGRDEMRTPLKNKSEVPEHKKKDWESRSNKRASRRANRSVRALKQKSQTKDKNWRQRNEETVTERGQAMPIGIAGDYIVEGRQSDGQIERKGLRGARREEETHN